HQRREGHIHALCALALEDVGVQRIEGEVGLVIGTDRGDQREGPALRRGRIDVVEMMELGGIFQIAEGRYAVRLGPALRRRGGGTKTRRAKRADAEPEHVLARQLRHARKLSQDRFPILAAFSVSYHHSEGRPERAYFGKGSAWLNLSQRA